MGDTKGVDCYAFLEPGQGFGCLFTLTKTISEDTTLPLGNQAMMQYGNLQVGITDNGITWQVTRNGQSLASHYADISATTGLVLRSDMASMLTPPGTPSVTGDGWALSYGFYDAGPGVGGLTDQDQSYAYLTGDQSTWMGDLVATLGPALANAPFNTWVLPGAHDAGMNDTTALQALLKAGPQQLLEPLGQLVGETVGALEALGITSILRAFINLAFTQKDSITTMLDLGVRYFDFRPGYCYQGLLAGIFHQHSFVPGYPLSSFLEDVLNWLKAHPSEIVAIDLNFSGFVEEVAKPAADTLAAALQAAQTATGTSTPDTASYIAVGGKADLGTSYQALLTQQTRLIFLNQIGAVNDALKYDSYTDSYETSQVQNILTALGAMNAAGQAGTPGKVPDYTVLQLQGTAASHLALVAGVLTLSDASSPLMSTKPGFDNRTYPWALGSVPANLSNDQLVVLLNDFADNALAWYAAQITALRVPLRFPAAAPIATVSCELGRTDLFAVAEDGGLYTTTSRNLAQWTAWQRIGGNPQTFAPGTRPVALSTSPGTLDVLVVGTDGNAYHASNPGPGWGPMATLPPRTVGNTPLAFPPGAAIAGVSAQAGWMDVFVQSGTDNKLYTSSSHAPSDFGTWAPVGEGVFPPGTPVTVLSDAPGAIAVFAVGTDGHVYGAYQADGGAWQDWSPVGSPAFQNLAFPAKTVVAGVSAGAGNLSLFIVDPQGQPLFASNSMPDGTFPELAWGPMTALLDPVGPLQLAPGAALACACPQPATTAIFAFDKSQTLRQASLSTDTPSGSSWSAVIPSATFPAGTLPAVQAPGSDAVQLAAVGTDGRVWNAWQQFGQWQGWFPIGS